MEKQGDKEEEMIGVDFDLDLKSTSYYKIKIMIGFSRKSWKNSKIFDRKDRIDIRDHRNYLSDRIQT